MAPHSMEPDGAEPDEKATLAEQVAYYRARALEYDEWFLRLGRYDRGEEHRRQWFDEVALVENALAAAGPAGDILELASGTGIWTAHLAPGATHLTCVDSSPEVIELNRRRIGDSEVRYVKADIFRWDPPVAYDFVFFGFWLSHVPRARFEDFWGLVRRALKPGGKVFFVDSLASPDSTAKDHHLEMGGTVERRLNDGRTFRVIKVFHDPQDLTGRLSRLGWQTDIRATPTFFLYGSAESAPSPGAGG